MATIIVTLALLIWPLNFFVREEPAKVFNDRPVTIFAEDYQARQLIIRNTYLYPNILLARAFQNKFNISVNKFNNNLFSLIDPNYYFFGSHPRERVGARNYSKFPFIAVIFLIYGLVTITKLTNYRKLLGLFLALVVLLSLLNNFDNYDLFLWPILSLIIFHGYRRLKDDYQTLTTVFVGLLLLSTIFEYVTLFTSK